MPTDINGVTCRTARESLEHIIAHAKAGRIGPSDKRADDGHRHTCLYEYPSGNNCAVGVLFSKAQLEFIRKVEGENQMIGHLARKHIGERNLQAVTGLPMRSLEMLQRAHDDTLSQSPQMARLAVMKVAQNMLTALKD